MTLLAVTPWMVRPLMPAPWIAAPDPPEMLKSSSELPLASVTISPAPELVSVAAPLPGSETTWSCWMLSPVTLIGMPPSEKERPLPKDANVCPSLSEKPPVSSMDVPSLTSTKIASPSVLPSAVVIEARFDSEDPSIRPVAVEPTKITFCTSNSCGPLKVVEPNA